MKALSSPRWISLGGGILGLVIGYWIWATLWDGFAASVAPATLEAVTASPQFGLLIGVTSAVMIVAAGVAGSTLTEGISARLFNRAKQRRTSDR